MPDGKTVEVDVSRHSKRIAILSMALVAGCGLAGLGAESTDQPNDVRPASEAQESFLSDSNLTQSSDLSLGGKELFVKMTLSVLLVVALAIGAMYLSKKVLPKVTKASGKEIRIMETAYLGPRKALHLVQIGGQRLLIGSTNESIVTLAHVGDAWLELPKQETDPTANQ